MRQADHLARRAERLGEMAMKVEARRNSVCGQCATAGEEDVCSTAIGTKLSARIVDPFSGEAVNARTVAAPLRLARRQTQGTGRSATSH